jgi:hypothetical protein
MLDVYMFAIDSKIKSGCMPGQTILALNPPKELIEKLYNYAWELYIKLKEVSSK